MRDTSEIKIQIVEGRKKGAERLILSGGEPTMHPNFLDFVKLGKRVGYPKVQTVTNGRMFAYSEFLARAAQHGLDEITFSLHGHTAELHDGLVATPGRTHLVEPISTRARRRIRGAHPRSVQTERRGAWSERRVRSLSLARGEALLPGAGPLQVLLPGTALRRPGRRDRRARRTRG